MERLFSLLGIYDLLGLILPGGLFAAGTYWAFAGFPQEPGGATTLGLVALFFIAGVLVQGAAVLWEGRYWQWRIWPSQRLMLEAKEGRVVLDDALKSLIEVRLNAAYGEEAAQLSTSARFALARAELRALGLGGRSELFNAHYSMARGLVTATAGLVVVFAVAAATTEDHRRNLVALAVALAAWPFFFNRFRRFSDWFARQVWQDYAALPERHAALAGRTPEERR
jgi:hypothetical protein